MHDHARGRRSRLPAEPAERDAEDREDREAEHEPVGEPERHARDQDRGQRRRRTGAGARSRARGRAAPRRTAPRASRPRRSPGTALPGSNPSLGHETLLVARVEELAQDPVATRITTSATRARPTARPRRRGISSASRRRSKPRAIARMRIEHDPVLDQRSDERRPEIEDVVGRLATGEAARVRGGGEERRRGRIQATSRPGLARGGRRGVSITPALVSSVGHATQYHSAHLTTYTASHAARIVAVTSNGAPASRQRRERHERGEDDHGETLHRPERHLVRDERQRDRDARRGCRARTRLRSGARRRPRGRSGRSRRRDPAARGAARRRRPLRAGLAGESRRSHTTFCASRNASGRPIQTARRAG